MVENAKIAVGISMLSIIVFQTKEISTSGLGGHIAISGCRSYSQSLSLNSPWSKMVQLKMKTVVLLLKQMGFFTPSATCVRNNRSATRGLTNQHFIFDVAVVRKLDFVT